jgi:hypothetical protein
MGNLVGQKSPLLARRQALPNIPIQNDRVAYRKRALPVRRSWPAESDRYLTIQVKMKIAEQRLKQNPRLAT